MNELDKTNELLKKILNKLDDIYDKLDRVSYGTDLDDIKRAIEDRR
jgi:hypothetical protein